MKEFIKWWVLVVTVVCALGMIILIDEGTADIYSYLTMFTFGLASYGLFLKK